MRNQIFAVMLMTLALPGGKVGPDFKPLDANINESWLDTGNPALVAEPLEFNEWWAVFEDPVLDDLVTRAYEQNLSRRIASLRVLEARARRGIAVGQFFPQLQNFRRRSAAIQFSDNDPYTFPLDKSFNVSSVGVDAVWAFDLRGNCRLRIESAAAAIFLRNQVSVARVCGHRVPLSHISIRSESQNA